MGMDVFELISLVGVQMENVPIDKEAKFPISKLRLDCTGYQSLCY